MTVKFRKFKVAPRESAKISYITGKPLTPALNTEVYPNSEFLSRTEEATAQVRYNGGIYTLYDLFGNVLTASEDEVMLSDVFSTNVATSGAGAYWIQHQMMFDHYDASNDPASSIRIKYLGASDYISTGDYVVQFGDTTLFDPDNGGNPNRYSGEIEWRNNAIPGESVHRIRVLLKDEPAGPLHVIYNQVYDRSETDNIHSSDVTLRYFELANPRDIYSQNIDFQITTLGYIEASGSLKNSLVGSHEPTAAYAPLSTTGTMDTIYTIDAELGYNSADLNHPTIEPKVGGVTVSNNAIVQILPGTHVGNGDGAINCGDSAGSNGTLRVEGSGTLRVEGVSGITFTVYEDSTLWINNADITGWTIDCQGNLYMTNCTIDDSPITVTGSGTLDIRRCTVAEYDYIGINIQRTGGIVNIYDCAFYASSDTNTKKAIVNRSRDTVYNMYNNITNTRWQGLTPGTRLIRDESLVVDTSFNITSTTYLKHKSGGTGITAGFAKFADDNVGYVKLKRRGGSPFTILQPRGSKETLWHPEVLPGDVLIGSTRYATPELDNLVPGAVNWATPSGSRTGVVPKCAKVIQEAATVIDEYHIQMGSSSIKAWTGAWGSGYINGSYVIEENAYPNYEFPYLYDSGNGALSSFPIGNNGLLDTAELYSNPSWSHGITLWRGQSRISNTNIKAIDEYHGIVQLSRPVEMTDVITATYLREIQSIPIMNLNLNPAYEPRIGASIDEEVKTVRIILKPAPAGDLSLVECLGWHYYEDNPFGVYGQLNASIIERDVYPALSSPLEEYTAFTSGYPIVGSGTLELDSDTVVLGDVAVVGVSPSDLRISDARTPGGGVEDDEWFGNQYRVLGKKIDTGARKKLEKESEYYFDIGSLDGVPYERNLNLVVYIPDSIIEGLTEELRTRTWNTYADDVYTAMSTRLVIDEVNKYKALGTNVTLVNPSGTILPYQE